MSETATKPDPADFSVDERADEYEVEFKVEGTVTRTIRASSIDEAREIAAEMEVCHVDNIDYIDIEYLRKSPAMYRVTRDGKNMQVSKLRDGDLPRQPDERGF